MERIIYRRTLDVHKNGVQFMLQGFETADNMSRVIEISLMANGDAIDFPLEKIMAMMYVTTPDAEAVSINKCTIKDNKVVFDVLPIVVEGITTMQLKLIETSVDGATSVLCSPKFAVEVTKSDMDESAAEQTTTFTALEDAVATAKATYDERLIKVEVDEKLIFRAFYADGTIYETDAIKEALYHGNALLSKSYAVGETGVREEEATDNSKYYSNVSRSSSAEARADGDYATDLLMEVRKHGVYTSFNMDFETGELIYASPSYDFKVDEESGELQAIGKDYNVQEVLESMVAENIAPEVAQMLSATLVQAINDLPDVNPNVAVYTDDLAKEFSTPTLVHWDSKTAFTPYASGLTAGNEGFALVYGKFTDKHTIVAWALGEEDNCFYHTVNGGIAKGWKGGKSAVSTDNEKTVISATKDENNARQISIANPLAEGVSLEDAVKVSDIVNGVKTDYKLFGEHNLSLFSNLFGNMKLETGTFKGIGVDALNAGQLPSIEFKEITPMLVIIVGERWVTYQSDWVVPDKGIYYFFRGQLHGFGFKEYNFLYFHQYFEGKKLSWQKYLSVTDNSIAEVSNSQTGYCLADPGTTYYYYGIGIGGAN